MGRELSTSDLHIWGLCIDICGYSWETREERRCIIPGMYSSYNNQVDKGTYHSSNLYYYQRDCHMLQLEFLLQYCEISFKAFAEMTARKSKIHGFLSHAFAFFGGERTLRKCSRKVRRWNTFQLMLY